MADTPRHGVPEKSGACEAFLKTTPTGRRDFIKRLIDPDDFSLRIFLDAVIMTLAWETPSKAKSQFWHKTLKLYEGVNNFSLNRGFSWKRS